VCVTGPTGLLQHGEGCWHLGFWVQRQLQFQNTGTRTWYGMWRMEHREHFQIERNNGFSTPAIQVSIDMGRCHPQSKPLRRVARPKDSCSQATVLGYQQWCLHRLENVMWDSTRQGMFRSAPMWKLVSSFKRAFAGVETARRPCRYSEHRPNVGCVYILRKCLVRAWLSPEILVSHDL